MFGAKYWLRSLLLLLRFKCLPAALERCQGRDDNDHQMTTASAPLQPLFTVGVRITKISVRCECDIKDNIRKLHNGGVCQATRTERQKSILADRTNGRAYATLLRPSVWRRLSSVTLCRPIVAKRCVLEQKLLLRAYRKSYMRNRLVPK